MSSTILPKSNGSYRLLHTADWHLGKMLGEHSRAEEHQRFLDFLLRTIRDQQADLLVVAGDIFDSANPPQSAEAQYYNFLSALFRQGGCSVAIIAGNHDSPAHLEAPRQVLKALNAHVLGVLPDSPADTLLPLPGPDSPRLLLAAVPFLRDRDLRIGYSGQSAAEIQTALVDGIKRRYDEVATAAQRWSGDGVPLVATGHLTVAGATTSDSEREIHIGGLGAVGPDCFSDRFSYVALGHLHRPQAARGNGNIRYSGSPIPLSFSEAADSKSIRLLDFDRDKLIHHADIPIPLTRPLAQIRTTRQLLEPTLAAFQPIPSEFKCWLEVVVEDPLPGENLFDRAREITEGKAFQVVRVAGTRSRLAGLATSDPTNTNDIADLLADPKRVFAHRLDAEPALTPQEKEGLNIAFAELLNLHAERGRQNDAIASGNAKPGGIL